MRRPRGALGGLRLVPALAAGITLFSLPAPLAAGDGKLEINQDCAAVGCFPGDAAGFPVTIMTPGSYILTSNLVVAGASAIGISADNTTLDLGGFEVAGDDDANWAGVKASNASNVEVRNGSIRDFGVGMNGLTATGLTIVGIRAVSNVGEGFGFTTQGTIIRDSSAIENGSEGFLATGSAAMVVDCTSIGNGSDGIRTGPSALVRGNIVRDNDGDGIDAGNRSVVAGNVVTFNGEHGINLSSNAIVKNNVALDNNTLMGMGFQNIEPCAGCLFVDNDDS